MKPTFMESWREKVLLIGYVFCLSWFMLVLILCFCQWRFKRWCLFLDYTPFIGFSLVHDDTPNDGFAGYSISSPPELFIDLRDPRDPLSSIAHVIEMLQATVKRCELLRAKMSVIPGASESDTF
jgi:hypothetical protein